MTIFSVINGPQCRVTLSGIVIQPCKLRQLRDDIIIGNSWIGELTMYKEQFALVPLLLPPDLHPLAPEADISVALSMVEIIDETTELRVIENGSPPPKKLLVSDFPFSPRKDKSNDRQKIYRWDV